MRHVWSEQGFERCPSCFNRDQVSRELTRRKLPPSWTALEPDTVIQVFGESSKVGTVIRDILNGHILRAHAYGMPGDQRQAFMGAIAYGFLRQNHGVQVLDTADLAIRHFSGGENQWLALEKQREPVVLQLGREIESKLGFFYFRTLLERAMTYQLPFVCVTDHPLDVMGGRYYEMPPLVQAVRFDVQDLSLNEGHASI